jgi:hypothetical protein
MNFCVWLSSLTPRYQRGGVCEAFFWSVYLLIMGQCVDGSIFRSVPFCHLMTMPPRHVSSLKRDMSSPLSIVVPRRLRQFFL